MPDDPFQEDDPASHPDSWLLDESLLHHVQLVVYLMHQLLVERIASEENRAKGWPNGPVLPLLKHHDSLQHILETLIEITRTQHGMHINDTNFPFNTLLQCQVAINLVWNIQRRF